MRDSDWSRQILLRSDWSGPRVALITTPLTFLEESFEIRTQAIHSAQQSNFIIYKNSMQLQYKILNRDFKY